MDRSKPFVITISRQIGSGGAYVGQQLAKKLNIYYADREILGIAAEKLSVLEKDLEQQEEKLQSFWETYFQISKYATDAYLNPKLIQPTTFELFNTESEIIKHIASEQSAVIIGRCGFHILRKHTNRVSVFLHADTAFRGKRIQDMYKVSEKEALEMITRTDKERACFIEEYTGMKWTDARQFDLCIDTGKIGIDKSVDIIIHFLESI
ncbi:MAG TPA: cytidylate kinase-like family protein [Marinilabiliales bacterium]|nr:MAG: hypothetical protein A2W84_08010 [Bacteroidetes bacterium GWC2_40_13]OFX76086.1 MAG: hypothetical protein A2W96_01405 [Bacteroidetes bacterium GWD2_40_43]OFX94300.1 MAG: hypothetical protein A2W97_19215 [Bacteroidetes bacterium GWE2_40_63]OFY18779.1 MAG: hypothetical protein A2W88_05980 [Bacteroidetes bacterium GWF2_40_13]OFZ24753.1 MAG: hypothetical protein A2437_15545 [Bacteroidetes bacterium RIFOXYC2_FULL_40_12]HAM99357.1 cytidylate kinase-like family protein [Marinilabiliales bacte